MSSERDLTIRLRGDCIGRKQVFDLWEAGESSALSGESERSCRMYEKYDSTPANKKRGYLKFQTYPPVRPQYIHGKKSRFSGGG